MDNGRNKAPVSPLAGQSPQGGEPTVPVAQPWSQEQATDQQTRVAHETMPTEAIGAEHVANADATAKMPPTQPEHASGVQAASQAAVQAKPVPNQAPAKQKRGFGKTVLGGFIGAVIALVVCFGGMSIYNNANHSNESSTSLGSSESTSINVSGESADLAEAVADKVLPSVVGIDVYTSSSTSAYGGWGQYFQDTNESSLTYTGLGSGVIISEDGYILTNYHVIEGAAELKVTANGEEYEAEVIGSDETSDLAVIKIDADNLTAIEIGSSADLKVGQWVMTAGSPFGLEQSVASGIISATSRTITVDNSTDEYGYSTGSSGDVSVYSDMIQTDAAINPGNSGGALVDENGKLIGINSVFSSASGSYAGVGFAIPVDYAINIADQIIDGETPTHAMLGVSSITITSDIASRYGLSTDEGAYVSAVFEGSAAESCGLEVGDIITKVNDTKITSSTDLVGACRSHQIGDTVSITYVRDGDTKTVDATLGSDENY